MAAIADRDPAVRKAAYEDLFSLGAPARKPLEDALMSRRGALIEVLADMKVLTSGRTRARLFQELQERRRHALSLIQDSRAWPYPNPTGANTEEVAARVDAVREIWERPFDVIVQWDEGLREQLQLVTEIDEVMVRLEPGYQPDLDDIRTRVNVRVDMPNYTPTSTSASVREYSLRVLAYNEKLTTTATREEKECVRAVNEYRMMMGRHAVRIHERLLRAARGHSRHMATHGYFAHNVPAGKGATPANRTPGARAKTQGYGGGVGENIARGTVTGREAFNAWFGSSGHHRNMINAGWTEMGAGRSQVSWWTQLFGAAGGKSLSEPDPLPDPDPLVAPEPEDEDGRPLPPGTPELPDEPPPGLPPPTTPDDEPDDP
ncbi:MAG: CAP domain-containing protein [Planctomycetota bacterium]